MCQNYSTIQPFRLWDKDEFLKKKAPDTISDMAYVFITQIGLDRYQVGRSSIIKESEYPIVWSLETKYSDICELFLRKKLEIHSCPETPECYEFPSSLLPQYTEEIERLLESFVEAQEAVTTHATADSNNIMLPASEEAEQLRFCTRL